MKLYLSILFDKPMTKYDQIPSPGGYEVRTSDNKTYGFDFMESEGWVDETDPCIVHWKLRDEDTDTFPEIPELRTKIPQITAITECYIDMEGMADLPGMTNKNIPKPLRITEFVLESVLRPNDDTQCSETVTTNIFDDFAIFTISDKLCGHYIFEDINDVKTVSVQFVWNMDVDVSGIDPTQVDKIRLAQDLAKLELYSLMEHNEFDDSDFIITATSNKSEL